MVQRKLQEHSLNYNFGSASLYTAKKSSNDFGSAPLHPAKKTSKDSNEHVAKIESDLILVEFQHYKY